MGQPALLLVGLPFVSEPSATCLATSNCSSTTLLVAHKEEEILTPWLKCLPGAFVGEYKSQGHIHRGVADPRLLAIPASRGRVAALDPNWDGL